MDSDFTGANMRWGTSNFTSTDSASSGNIYLSSAADSSTVWQFVTVRTREKVYRPGYTPVKARDRAKDSLDRYLLFRGRQPVINDRKPERRELVLSAAKRRHNQRGSYRENDQTDT